MTTICKKLAEGTRVMVMNTTMSGKLIEEGIATLIKPYPHDPSTSPDTQLWSVQFDGDDSDNPVDRYVESKNIQTARKV